MEDKIKSIITCDLDGKIETFSEGAVKLFGYTKDEVIGKKRVSDFSPGEVVLGHVVNWLKIAVDKGEWEGETVFLGKDKNENKDEDKEKEKREMKMKIKNTLSATSILGPPLRLQWLTYAENGSLEKVHGEMWRHPYEIIKKR